MKIAIVMLVVLGVVAAGAAALFVQSTSLLKAPKENPMVDVLVAKEDLTARTLLTEAQVEVKKMSRVGLPSDCLSNWSQAAGKILKLNVIKGQPFANSSFVPKDSIDDLLRPGMLAFPIHLARRVTAENLFYPGCVVDVFATFPLSNRQKGEAVVFPLLQGVRVLGVANETVVTAQQAAQTKGGAPGNAPQPRGGASEAIVTLEVNSRQASALQLAMERGTLGLGMRNPTDRGLNPMEPMVVKEGQLTAASEALDPQTLAMVDSIQRILNPERPADPNAPRTPPTLQPVAQVPDPNMPPSTGNATSPVGTTSFIGLPTEKQKTGWEVVIIRGAKSEKTELDVDSEGKPLQELKKKTE
jgi:pilus assembly protein CpaB